MFFFFFMSVPYLTYFVWNCTSGSSLISDMSIVRPRLYTSGCLRCISQPTCAKKNPLFALCGSASVSLNLWCTLWSRTQSGMEFCKNHTKIYCNLTAFGCCGCWRRYSKGRGEVDSKLFATVRTSDSFYSHKSRRRLINKISKCTIYISQVRTH